MLVNREILKAEIMKILKKEIESDGAGDARAAEAILSILENLFGISYSEN